MNKRAILRSLLASLLAASVLVISSPAVTNAAWSSSCGWHSQKACMWESINYTVPLAANTIDVTTYWGIKYPNTQTWMNDTVSSVENEHTANAVIWYTDANFSGTAYCVPALWTASSLGGLNDTFSSHIAITTSYCP